MTNEEKLEFALGVLAEEVGQKDLDHEDRFSIISYRDLARLAEKGEDKEFLRAIVHAAFAVGKDHERDKWLD